MRLALSILSALVLWSPTALAHCDAGRWITNAVPAPLCVPTDPRRVVVVDPFYNLGMALELGVPVVGAPLSAAPDDDLRTSAERAGVADIGNALQPSMERIVALKPDLIVGDAELHGAFLERLNAIAPTALIRAPDWKAHLRILAAIAGRPEGAADALRVYETRVADIRARMPANGTVSVVRIAPHGFQVYLDGPDAYAPYAVLHEAGVKRTAYETTDDDTVLRRPDWEDIAALEGDILLYVVAAGNAPGQDDELERATVGNPFWRMLPAMRSGRAYRVDKAHWFGFNGVNSAHRVLDDVERYVLGRP